MSNLTKINLHKFNLRYYTKPIRMSGTDGNTYKVFLSNNTPLIVLAIAAAVIALICVELCYQSGINQLYPLLLFVPAYIGQYFITKKYIVIEKETNISL